MRKFFGGLAASAALLLALTGCSMSGESSDGLAPMPPEYTEGASGGDKDNSGGGETTDRSVIQTGYISLETESPVAAYSQIATQVAAVAGRIDERIQQSNDAGVVYSIYITIRVPADKLQTLIDDISDLGEAKRVDVTASDVTVVVVDLEARVQSLKASVTRLLDLMANATTTSELLEAEYALSTRQAELEGVEAQLRYYQDQVSLSTLTVSISQPGAGEVAAPQNFWEGLVLGWEALLGFGSWALVALGVILPWLLPLGAIGLLVVWLIRRSRKAKGRS